MSQKRFIGNCRFIPLKRGEKIRELRLEKKVEGHCEKWWIVEERKALYIARMLLSYKTGTEDS